MANKLPGMYQATFNPTVSEPSATVRRGSDGRPWNEWYETADMEQETDYHGKLRLFNGKWKLRMEWNDLDGNSHDFILPNEVIVSLLSAVGRIEKARDSDTATRAAETRKRNGVVPFQRKTKAG